MTNKQRKAIDRLNKDKKHPLACGDITIVNIADIDTILSLIKEQQEEIERIRYIKECFDYVVQKETEKKDKQIDLMAKAFKQDDVRTVEEIKQYFARLIEKE